MGIHVWFVLIITKLQQVNSMKTLSEGDCSRWKEGGKKISRLNITWEHSLNLVLNKPTIKTIFETIGKSDYGLGVTCHQELSSTCEVW